MTAQTIAPEREVCSDCGCMSVETCPYGAATCSECSMLRDDTKVPCEAHGPYPPDLD